MSGPLDKIGGKSNVDVIKQNNNNTNRKNNKREKALSNSAQEILAEPLTAPQSPTMNKGKVVQVDVTDMTIKLDELNAERNDLQRTIELQRKRKQEIKKTVEEHEEKIKHLEDEIKEAYETRLQWSDKAEIYRVEAENNAQMAQQHSLEKEAAAREAEELKFERQNLQKTVEDQAGLIAAYESLDREQKNENEGLKAEKDKIDQALQDFLRELEESRNEKEKLIQDAASDQAQAASTIAELTNKISVLTLQTQNTNEEVRQFEVMNAETVEVTNLLHDQFFQHEAELKTNAELVSAALENESDLSQVIETVRENLKGKKNLIEQQISINEENNTRLMDILKKRNILSATGTLNQLYITKCENLQNWLAECSNEPKKIREMRVKVSQLLDDCHLAKSELEALSVDQYTNIKSRFEELTARYLVLNEEKTEFLDHGIIRHISKLSAQADVTITPPSDEALSYRFDTRNEDSKKAILEDLNAISLEEKERYILLRAKISEDWNSVGTNLGNVEILLNKIKLMSDLAYPLKNIQNRLDGLYSDSQKKLDSLVSNTKVLKFKVELYEKALATLGGKLKEIEELTKEYGTKYKIEYEKIINLIGNFNDLIAVLEGKIKETKSVNLLNDYLTTFTINKHTAEESVKADILNSLKSQKVQLEEVKIASEETWKLILRKLPETARQIDKIVDAKDNKASPGMPYYRLLTKTPYAIYHENEQRCAEILKTIVGKSDAKSELSKSSSSVNLSELASTGI